MNPIKEILKIKNPPESPGVYKMIDAEGIILYIGKAKNLKNRLESYANKNQNLKNIAMLSLVRNIDFIRTKTEIHALLLEAAFIRDIKPKYNIVLKDDKSFSYVYFSTDKQPAISIQKKLKQSIENNKNLESSFFGPFYNKATAKKMLEIIKNNFKIRDCSNVFFNNRNSPCIEYHINKCSAPCVNKISQEEYLLSIENAKKFLKQDNKNNLIKEYKNKMLEASKEENYILAKSYQEKIKFLNEVSTEVSSKYNNFDIITFVEKDNKIILCYVIYRGSILIDKVFNIINKVQDYENIIAQNVHNFYQIHKTPEIIFLTKSMHNITFAQN